MAGYTLSDFDEVNTALTDRKLVDASRRNVTAFSWRNLFNIAAGPWEGMSLKVPILSNLVINATPRAVNGNLATAYKSTLDSWTILDSDFKSFDIPVEVNTEYLRFDDKQRVLRYMEIRMMEAQRSYDAMLDRWYIGDGNGTLAVVSAITKVNGTDAIDGAATQCVVKIDRTSTVGSIGRILKGDIVGIHAGAPGAADVRVYARVLSVRPGTKLGTIAATASDLVYLTNASITQTSLSLGGNAVDSTFANVANGDYICLVNGYTTCPKGLDAVAAGTDTTLFGVDQTDVACDFATPTKYAFDAEFDFDKLDSALQMFRSVINPAERALVMRITEDHWRSMKVFGDTGLRAVRQLGQSVGSPLAQFGWKPDNWVYIPSFGSPIGLWVDPMQNYTTIDLIPGDIWTEYEPPNAPPGEWLTDPKNGSGIDWQNKRSVSGSTSSSTFEYEAHRVPHRILFCRQPEKWLRLTGVTAKAYS